MSVAEQVLTLVTLGKTKNPYFAPDQLLDFNKAYVAWRGGFAREAARRQALPGSRRSPARRRGAFRAPVRAA